MAAKPAQLPVNYAKTVPKLKICQREYIRMAFEAPNNLKPKDFF